MGNIDPEMIERGAIGLWLDYKAEWVSGPSSAAGWDEVVIKEWYRRKAMAVLYGALETKNG